MLPSAASYIWEWDSSYKNLKASAYIGGKSYASESWAISPEIDMANCTNGKIAFQHTVNKFSSLDFAKQSTGLYIRESGGQWQELSIPNYATNTNWDFVSTSVDIPASFNGKKIQLGFKYTSADNDSGTWEIKDVKVSALK